MNDKRQSNKNPYKVVTIILSIVILGLVGSLVFLLVDKGDRDDNIVGSRAVGGKSESEAAKADMPGGERQERIVDNANYLEFAKLGVRMPIDKQLADQFEVVEVNNGYRIDLKMISDYRVQGLCGNGGSSAIGIISSQTASLAEETKSSFFGNMLFHFTNNVVYPDQYITFVNTDAACWDLGAGGTERGQAVAKKVNELKPQFIESLRSIKPSN